MSEHVRDLVEVGRARIVEAPAKENTKVRHQVEHDRTFEIPAALYGMTVCSYAIFLGLTAAAFASPGLILPMAIFVFIIAAGFGVPAIWTRLKSGNPSSPLSMGEFTRKGIMTHTGWLSAREASAQMLILPVLVVLWGVAVVTIAALV